MKKNLIIGTLIISSLTQIASQAQASGKDIAGGIIGGVVGGLLGSQVGGGNGKKIAIGVGAIAGAMLGMEVGREMDQNDQRAYEENQRRCLEGRLGESREWRGSDYGSRTGTSGVFQTTREGYNSRGEYCREYTSVVRTRSGREDRQSGIACSGRNGTWSEETSSVNWNNDGGGRANGGYGGGHGDGRGPRPGRPGPAPMPPPPPVRNGGQGEADIYGVGRRPVWYRLSLQRPMNISVVQVLVRRGRMAVQDAYVITDRNERVSIRVGDYVNSRSRIIAVDLLLQSDGNADTTVVVSSDDGQPRLSVQRF